MCHVALHSGESLTLSTGLGELSHPFFPPLLSTPSLQWFAAVHLLSVLGVARATLHDVCSAPAFIGAAAQQQFARASLGARFLALLSPLPAPQSVQGSCVDALSRASGGGDVGECACRQVASWVLACVGFALPLAAQFLAEAANRRRFLRKHCRKPHCDACAAGKGADLPVLSATAVLLLASFCAVSWQLVSAAFVAEDALAAAAAAAELAGSCAAGAAAAGECSALYL